MIAAVSVVALALVGGAGWFLGRRNVARAEIVRLSMTVPSDAPFANIYAGPPLAISPDGMTIAYTARTVNGPQLALRRLDELTPHVLSGTVAGIYPSFVNDGTALAYSDGAEFYRVGLDGTAVTAASTTQAGAGNGTYALPKTGLVLGSFQSDAGRFSGLSIIRAFGDSILPLTHLGATPGEFSHRFPVVVDERTVLFASYSRTRRPMLGIASLTDGTFTLLDLPGVAPLGMVDDYLIYVRSDGATDGLVTAVKINLEKRKVIGEPVTLERGIAVHGNGSVEAALSASGTLVYSGGVTMSRMVSVDLRGAVQPLFPEPRRLASPRYSPDGGRIVVNRTDESSEVWIYDVRSKVPTRLTSDGSFNDRPEWSADGQRIAYRGNLGTYFWQRTDGTDRPSVLSSPSTDSRGAVAEVAMVPDGKRIIVREPRPGTGMDLMIETIGDTSSKRPFVNSRFNEFMPAISRDGKWVAYISPEAGPLDVYVRAMDGSGRRFPVSTGGGMEPRWSPDGRRIYYRANRTIVAANVSSSPTFSVTSRDTLFADAFATDPFHTNYDVAPDGAHFVMLQPVDNNLQATVVLNFASEVRMKMAASRR
jgi:serine/threonine-protein kinase